MRVIDVREEIEQRWFTPDLDFIVIMCRQVLVSRCKTELFDDMLHNGTGFNDPYIIPIAHPPCENALGVAFVFTP